MMWERFLFGTLRKEAEDSGDDSGSGDKGKGGEKGKGSDSEEEDEEEDDEDGEGDEEDDDEEEDSSKKKVTKKKDEEDDLSEDEVKQAKALLKLLKDPATAKHTIAVMAKNAGIEVGEGKATEKAVKKDAKKVIDVLKEEFGDSKLDFLIDKLAPALEKILKQERDKNEETITSLTKAQIENETEAALNRLSKESKGESRKYEAKMADLMGSLTPKEGVSTFDYLKMLYNLASSGSKAESIKNQIADKMKRNSRDAASRLESSSGDRGNLKIPSKKMTSREAAEFAMKSIMANKDED